MTTQDTKVDWGAAIPVDGKRPEWLTDSDVVSWYSVKGQAWRAITGAVTAAMLQWDANVADIRLPADHPYYTQPTPTDEVRDRMEALTRRIASLDGIKAPETPPSAWVAEARSIVALLDPVDPVHVEARMIAQEYGIVCEDERAPVYLAIEKALRARNAFAEALK